MNHNLETLDTPEYLHIDLPGVVDESYPGQMMDDFDATLTEASITEFWSIAGPLSSQVK